MRAQYAQVIKPAIVPLDPACVVCHHKGMEREHDSSELLSALIGQEVNLVRAGREWRACCPFHDENTPSFYVNDAKGFYHCFGCAAHGDASKWAATANERKVRQASKIAPPAVRPEPIKIGGGKLNRSETVTVRLDPKLNYLCELAARAQRRTKSSFIEWAVAESLASVTLPEVREQIDFDDYRDVTIKDRASQLWEVDEADRVVTLALTAPALLTHEEQMVWRLVRENGAVWKGQFDHHDEWIWTAKIESLVVDRLRKHWPTFQGVARGELSEDHLPTWKKTKQPSFDDDVPF